MEKNIYHENKDLGTRKYHIKINKSYIVDFEEVEDNKGKGSYHNGVFDGIYGVPTADKIIVSDDKEKAMIIDGQVNLKSYIDKILGNWEYEFYNIEIIEFVD